MKLSSQFILQMQFSPFDRDVNKWINDECAECVPPRLNLSDRFTRLHRPKGENHSFERASLNHTYLMLLKTSFEEEHCTFLLRRNSRQICRDVYKGNNDAIFHQWKKELH
jgi:hypothetical protein